MNKKNTSLVSGDGWYSKLKQRHKETLWMYILLAPNIIGLLIFRFIPMIAAIGLSFSNWSLANTSPQFIGFDNYVQMATNDRVIPDAIKVTVSYAVFSIVLSMLLSFVLALMMSRNKKGVGVFRSAYYLPSMMATGVPVMLVWIWLLGKDGMIDKILGLFGIAPIGMLHNPQYSLFALVFMMIFGCGGQMLIFVAGLKNVPAELYEAAYVDGANAFTRLFRITLPMITPIIFYNLIMGIVGGLQTFTQGYIMTGGGPRNKTMFWVLHTFNMAFKNFKAGYASAMSVALFAVIVALTAIVFKTSGGWVFYGGDDK